MGRLGREAVDEGIQVCHVLLISTEAVAIDLKKAEVERPELWPLRVFCLRSRRHYSTNLIPHYSNLISHYLALTRRE